MKLRFEPTVNKLKKGELKLRFEPTASRFIGLPKPVPAETWLLLFWQLLWCSAWFCCNWGRLLIHYSLTEKVTLASE